MTSSSSGEADKRNAVSPGAAVAEGYRRSSWTPKGTAFTGMDGMKVIALFAEHWEVTLIPDLHLRQVLRWIYSRYAPRDGHIRIVDDIH